MSTTLSLRLAPLVLALALAGCTRQSGPELRAQAAQLHQKGDFAAALVVLKNAAQSEPDNPETRFLLATTYLDTGDAVTAEKEARMALHAGYARPEALAALGRALVMRGEFKKALDETASGAGQPALLPVRADAELALGGREQARALFTQALQGAPGSPEALVGLGRIAWLDGDAAAAHAYAERVLRRTPGNLAALMFRADLLRAEGKHAQALAVYDKVVALSPQHRSAHVEKAYLAIGLHRYDMAQAELDTAFKIAPGSLLAVYTQALLDYTRGRYPAARDSLMKLLRAAPEHMPSVLLAGAVSLKLGSNYLAEHHLRHYLESHPDNVQARKMLASALIGTGHGAEALDVLAPAMQAAGAGPDVQLLAIAGDSNMQVGRFGPAADLFAKASALDPDSAELRTSLGLSRLNKGELEQALRELQAATRLDRKSVQAAEALVRTELKLGRLDAALEAATALARAQPDSAVAHELLGSVHAARGKPDAARAGFERALALAPSHYPAAAGLSQLALDGKDPAGARQAMLAFLGRNKTSVQAMSALALLAEGAGDKAGTTRWLEAAAAVDPSAVGPAVNLIAQYLRTGAPEKALNLARKLQVAHPDNPDLLDLLGKSQLANGRLEDALDTYRNLATALPRSAQVLMQVAGLHLLLDHPVQAEEDLKGVLAMQPDFPSAEVELAGLYVRKGSPDLALIVADRLQRRHPDGAAGWTLEGDVLMAKRQPAQALAAYEHAFAMRATNELLIKIDNALRLAARREEAVRRLDRWLDAHPSDARTLAYRAQTWLAEGAFRRAADQLEAVLRLQPKNAVVLNNLALAYQELGDARALATAEAALQHAGGRPDVMDTLAWILVGRGDTARALPMLRKAHALAPKARDIRYHLAAALARAGERDAARKELEALAAGDMGFAQGQEARKLLERLRAET